MSYDRYLKYSQGKTVGEALALGSLPLDLVNDLEKKILKRVGGPIRDKPLNLLEETDTSNLTKTDMIIARWGYQLWKAEAEKKGMSKEELAKGKEAYRKAMVSVGFGVKAENLAQGTGWAESSTMVAMRSKANVEAGSILEAAAAESRKINDADVLKVLRLWAVKKNLDRKNVMPEGKNFVYSENIGLLHCSGGRLIATLHTKQYPKVLTLFAQWMKDNRPDSHSRDFPFTSITVNSSFAARRHRDHLNVGPSIVKAFGDFEGGRLQYWGDDDKSTSLDVLLDKSATVHDVRKDGLVLDGNRAHAVENYTGEERFSLVFFTAQGYEKVAPEVKDQLVEVGIPFPDEEAVAYAKSLLPAPKGYTEYAEKKVQKKNESETKQALSLLRGLKKPQKGGMFARMMAMRAAADSVKEKEPREKAPKEKQTPSSAGADGKEIAKPVSTSNLLSKVIAQKTSATKVPKPSGGKKKRLLVMGGLLGRMQNQNQALPEPEEPLPGSPTVTKAENSSQEVATPARKRPREEDAKSPVPLSGKKQPSPASFFKRMAKAAADSEPSTKVQKIQAAAENLAVDTVMREAQAKDGAETQAPEPDDTCLHFLEFATVLSEATGEVSQASDAIAASLKRFAQNASNREESLHSALLLMEPTLSIPARHVAAAIAAAFGHECPASMGVDLMAAKALEGRQIKQESLPEDQQLKIGDIAGALLTCISTGQEEEESSISQVTKMLERTKTGMEAFFVVRALSGKLAPSRDVVQRAVAKGMSQLVCR